MKLFLDRNKTLLPRIDVIFLLTRFMTFVSICWFGFFDVSAADDQSIFIVITSTYAIIIAVLFAAIKGKFDIKLAYLGSIIYDVVFLPLFVLYTGSIDSSFYLFFYLTVSVGAYVLTFMFAFLLTLTLCVSYILVVASQFEVDDIFGFSIRIGFMWICFLALSYISDYMRRSESRLMKLFNTLNRRTSELEKSQVLLEMIYEHTRILTGLLDPDSVIREVTKIVSEMLQYPNFFLITRHPKGEFFYRSRTVNGKTSFHLKGMQAAETDLISKVAEMHETVRVNNISERKDYSRMNDQSKSIIICPLTFHDRSQGLLIAESEELNFFNERDEQLLSVVARSAGLALENAELHKRTEELSIIDELTSAYNYRYFIQKLEEEKKRAVRYQSPLSIMMIDIDWFKKLNDSYGHETGNLVLKGLAQVIKSCIRDVDIFARYGGEEFVVILPQTDQDEAKTIGERIRSQVEEAITDTELHGQVKITVSIGISSYPANVSSEEQLVSKADQALYEAKDSGKNLVCVS